MSDTTATGGLAIKLSNEAAAPSALSEAAADKASCSRELRIEC